uniref:Uncharacterized protein n=1 Tax=Sweet potato vein clearing virus TaxID=995049 RepID=A0A2R4VA44_9VIRU|nr:hypothetical protein [Sweet potato vein clearing virus]
MTEFKDKSVELRKYNIDAVNLPSESFKRWPYESMTYAEFIPFLVTGVYGQQSEKMLNWTNLAIFELLKRTDKLKINELSQALLEKDEFKILDAIGKLPTEVAKIIKENRNIVGQLQLPVEVQVARLTTKLEKIEKSLEKISMILGIIEQDKVEFSYTKE